MGSRKSCTASNTQQCMPVKAKFKAVYQCKNCGEMAPILQTTVGGTNDYGKISTYITHLICGCDNCGHRTHLCS